MASRSSRPARRRNLDTPLSRPRIRVGQIDATGIASELRQLHEKAEDPSVERMPEAAELWGVLLYAEQHAQALKTPAARKEASLKRTLLWEYLKEQVDPHQERAVRDAVEAGAEWAEIASYYAVKGPSGAYQKARRQHAAVLSAEDGAVPVRRTPEAVARAEAERAAAERAERQQERVEAQRHAVTAQVARTLLAAREGLRVDDEADYWLEQAETVLEDCRTPKQFASLAVYLSAALRYLDRPERYGGPSAAVTAQGREALESLRRWQADQDRE